MLSKTKLTASFVYAGYSDYWGGHGDTICEDYSEHLLYAFYGRDTSLKDIIEQLVEDSWTGPASETLSEEVTEDDVRKALLDMLTKEGRANYGSGAVAECSAAWTDENTLEECPECGHVSDSEECPECGHVFDDDYDYESPIFVAVLTQYAEHGDGQALYWQALHGQALHGQALHGQA